MTYDKLQRLRNNAHDYVLSAREVQELLTLLADAVLDLEDRAALVERRALLLTLLADARL